MRVRALVREPRHRQDITRIEDPTRGLQAGAATPVFDLGCEESIRDLSLRKGARQARRAMPARPSQAVPTISTRPRKSRPSSSALTIRRCTE